MLKGECTPAMQRTTAPTCATSKVRPRVPASNFLLAVVLAYGESVMRTLTSCYVYRELCPQRGHRRPRNFAGWVSTATADAAAASTAIADAAAAKTSGRNQQ